MNKTLENSITLNLLYTVYRIWEEKEKEGRRKEVIQFSQNKHIYKYMKL